jgi:hypothetical protein
VSEPSALFALGEFGSRPDEARSAGVFRRLRVALLFGYFLLGKQEKVTRCRAASGINAVKVSPQAIQHKIKTGFRLLPE